MTKHVVWFCGRIPRHRWPSLCEWCRMRYSQYRHAVEGGNGHLWQSRYYSCAVEPQRLGAVMRYVET